MKIEKIILSVILLCFLLPASGQVAESEMVVFDLSGESNNVGPEIIILSPTFSEDGWMTTHDEQEEIILQVNDDSKIRFISVNKDVRLDENAGGFASTVKLIPGDNRIAITAGNERNRTTELIRWIKYEPPVVSLEDRILGESRYFGLVIGINDYQDEKIRDLHHPVADARSFYECLVTHYTFDHENVTFLKNPTREEIISKLDNLRGKVSSNDNVVIFYAGHGHYDEKADQGYWLPSDARKSSTAAWFRNSALIDYIDAIDSRHTLLISDACFSGSIFEENRNLDMAEEKEYETYYVSRSRKAMTSGAKTEVPDKSVFVQYLLSSLKSNSETYLTSEDLFYSFKKNVLRNSDDNSIPQYGVIRNVGSEGGDFVFLRRKD